MSRRFAILGVLGGLAALACTRAAPVPDTAAEVKAVNDVGMAEVAALSAGDTLLDAYADGVVMMPPNQPALVGKPAVRAWVQGLYSQASSSITYPSTEVIVSGDWAIQRYTAHFTTTPLAGGPATTDTLKGIHVFKRQADGAWKIVHDIWNSDVASAMGH